MNTWYPAGSSVLRGHGTFTDGALMEGVGHLLDARGNCELYNSDPHLTLLI